MFDSLVIRWKKLDREKQEFIIGALVGGLVVASCGTLVVSMWPRLSKRMAPAIKEIFENENGDVLIHFRNGTTRLIHKNV